MKVIDKRGKKQANDWQVGDVVCFGKMSKIKNMRLLHILVKKMDMD